MKESQLVGSLERNQRVRKNVSIGVVVVVGSCLLGVIGCEGPVIIVVRVKVSRKDRIPARAFLRVVFDEAVGQVVVWDAVGVVTVGGVDCVGAVCAVDDGLLRSC
jgi:hypothetical protein